MAQMATPRLYILPCTLACSGIEGYGLLPLSLIFSCSKVPVPELGVRICLELVEVGQEP